MRDNFCFGAAEQLAIPNTDVLQQSNQSVVVYEIHKPRPGEQTTYMTILYDLRESYTWQPQLLFTFLLQKGVASESKQTKLRFNVSSLLSCFATLNVEYDDFDQLVGLIREYYETEPSASQKKHHVSKDFDEQITAGWGLKFVITPN